LKVNEKTKALVSWEGIDFGRCEKNDERVDVKTHG